MDMYLHQTCIITRDDELAVRTNITTAGDILEAGNCLCDFLSSGCINLDTGCCCYSIPVRFRGRELDGSDRSVFFDEDWVFKLTPIS
jgi:hypothetical protein